MLNSFEKNIIALVKSSLDGTKPSISEGLDLEVVYEFAQKMQITPLMYYGIEKIPGVFDTTAGKKFFKSLITYSFVCQEQNKEIENILSEFDSQEIDCMSIKGTKIRELYKHPEMRLMSDADILVKPKQYSKIKKIMRQNGYKEVLESNHEYVWKKNGINIELHKKLVPSYNKDYYAYFEDPWRLAKKEAGKNSRCEMSCEDHLIYLFVHYAKHYRDSGIGIKHVLDIYVYLSAYKDLDIQYIEAELEKIKLLEFWKNTRNMLDAWFLDKECDEISAFMTHKIFSGSVYGTSEANVLSTGLKMSKSTKNVKNKSLMTSIFPPYADMKQTHKYLKPLPFLYPLSWVFRWVGIVLNPKRIRNKKKKLDKMSSQNIEKYQSELNYVGLDYNF